MEKKLDVKNLRISFRTVNGKVQAVRDVSFSLKKGETLAIVGESGSGKSVTSRAILGILAGNAIIESGEIIYDGKDLLKISEEDFHSVRGDKIAMIFQDPMSSLNPIMRIGKQLTEAMLLKNAANRRENKKNFNRKLALLLENMNAVSSGVQKDAANAANAQKIKNFDAFEYVHVEHERNYNDAYMASDNTIEEINNLLFEISKSAVKDIVRSCTDIAKEALNSFNRFVVYEKEAELTELVNQLKTCAAECKKSGNNNNCTEILEKINSILKEAVAKPKPNFFSLGYYLKFVNPEIPDIADVNELNAMTCQALYGQFMDDFLMSAQEGVQHSFNTALANKQKAINLLQEKRVLFARGDLDKDLCRELYKELTDAVEGGINRLDIIKDSTAYIFGSSLKSAINFYFARRQKNAKETARFEKQKAKHAALTAKGRRPDWKIVPADIIDLEIPRGNILQIIDNNIKNYQVQIANADKFNSKEATEDLVEFFKGAASSSVYEITPSMAKKSALRLMEEVGISEPRKRYTQFPFEFSGGMRQRIVIAIALAANPDILICDEPTTALDVTIQAQILELINKLKNERQLSIIFITHNLGVVANMADRIAVMYAGKIVEYGNSMEVFYNPKHPYTWALLSSMPDLDTKDKLDAIPGTPPNMIYPPKGDAFALRNKYALDIDFELEPPMFKVTDTHYAATWLLHEKAPKVDPPKVVTDRIARMKHRGGSDNV